MLSKKPETIDEYIAGFPVETQKVLGEVREIMRKAAPEATETISYGIPTFQLNGKYLIYFAGYKKHIGVYPVPNEEPEFEKDFAAYKTSGKGAIQFPLNKPMPSDLITRIVKFRIKKSQEKREKK